MILLLAQGAVMTVGFIFWLVMLLWLLGLFFYWPRIPSAAPGAPLYWTVGGHLLIFLLFFLLGYEVFGWPVK
jgi:hypothetical protein